MASPLEILVRLLRAVPTHSMEPRPTKDIARLASGSTDPNSIRNIQRNLRKLEGPDYQLVVSIPDNEVANGSSWKLTDRAGRLLFDPPDAKSAALVVLLSHRWSQQLSSEGLVSVIPGFQGAKKILESRSRKRSHEWDHLFAFINVSPGSHRPAFESSKLEKLAQAVLDRKQVRCSQGRKTSSSPVTGADSTGTAPVSFAAAPSPGRRPGMQDITLCPLGIIDDGSRLLLVWQDHSGNLHHDLVADLEDIIVLSKDFIVSPSFTSVQDYAAAGRLLTGEHRLRHIRLVIDIQKAAGDLRDVWLSEIQSIENLSEEWTRVTAENVHESDELFRWVLGHGSNADVVEPVSLRRRVRDAVQRMSGLSQATWQRAAYEASSPPFGGKGVPVELRQAFRSQLSQLVDGVLDDTSPSPAEDAWVALREEHQRNLHSRIAEQPPRRLKQSVLSFWKEFLGAGHRGQIRAAAGSLANALGYFAEIAPNSRYQDGFFRNNQMWVPLFEDDAGDLMLAAMGASPYGIPLFTPELWAGLAVLDKRARSRCSLPEPAIGNGGADCWWRVDMAAHNAFEAAQAFALLLGDGLGRRFRGNLVSPGLMYRLEYRIRTLPAERKAGRHPP